jgi:pimeloyl-ACP methyl ester carboxylesterase
MTKEFANTVEFVKIPHSCHWYAEENPLGVVKEIQAFIENSGVSPK